jgi:hypothetical protein
MQELQTQKQIIESASGTPLPTFGRVSAALACPGVVDTAHRRVPL